MVIRGRLIVHAPVQLRQNGLSLVDTISNHMLGFFLVANVVTGTINLAIDTMAVSNGTARLVLAAYLTFLCGGVPVIAQYCARHRHLFLA